MPFYRKYSQILNLLWCYLLLSTPLLGMETYVGWGFLEGGDDRWQLSNSLQLKIPETITGDVAYSQMGFGPVTIDTLLLGASKEFKLFYPKNLYGQLGMGYLQTTTKLSFRSEEDQSQNERAIQKNLGLLLGIHWRSDFNGFWQYGFSWQSYIFAAGPLAGLLLAVGRKQMITASVGFNF